MVVEIFYFEGCPHYAETRELVERVSTELGVSPQIELVRVDDVGAAERLRFLGSPTVRVNGRDVEPGADAREAFAFGCRVYDAGAGVPGEHLVRDALVAAA